MKPSEIDLFDEEVNFRTQYREYCERVEQLSNYVQGLRARAAKEDAQLPQLWGTDFICYAGGTVVREEIKRQYDDWTLSLFTHYALMREVRHYDGKCDALGMHVFLELTQLNAQLARPSLLVERENLATIAPELLTGNYDSLFSLAKTAHPLWVQVLNSFECPPLNVKERGEEEEDDGSVGDRDRIIQLQGRMKQLWHRPILEATQREVRLIVLFLTQQLYQLPTRNPTLVAEYRRVFNLVWLRIASLTNQAWPGTVLDDELISEDGKNEVLETMRQPVGNTGLYAFNRDFAMFCFYYMSEIHRCFYHYDMLRARPPLRGFDAQALGAKVHGWITRVVTDYADDSFEDLYTSKAVMEGYHFIGDDYWFKYAYPNNVHSRGACITQIRPHLYRSFYSEANLSKMLVLSHANNGDYVATLFVMHALHEYLRIHTPRVSWLNGCVVDSGGYDQSAYLLSNPLCPVLIQVLSFYWVYCPREEGGPLVHICDNIYEAIGVWFWTLQTYFGGRLYDIDMSEYMREVLPIAAADADADIDQVMADAMNDFEI